MDNNWVKVSELLAAPNITKYEDEIEKKKEEFSQLFNNADIEYKFNINQSDYSFILELYVKESDAKKASIIIDKYDRTFEEFPEELKEEIPDKVAKRDFPYVMLWTIISFIFIDIPLLCMAIYLSSSDTTTHSTTKIVVWALCSGVFIFTFKSLYKTIKEIKNEEKD